MSLGPNPPAISPFFTIVPLEIDLSSLSRDLPFASYRLSCLPSDIDESSNPLYLTPQEAIASILDSPPPAGAFRLLLPHSIRRHCPPSTPTYSLESINEWLRRHRYALYSDLTSYTTSHFDSTTGEPTYRYDNECRVERWSHPLVLLGFPVASTLEAIPHCFLGTTALVDPSLPIHDLPYRDTKKTAYGFKILSTAAADTKAIKASATRSKNRSRWVFQHTLPATVLNPLIDAFTKNLPPSLSPRSLTTDDQSPSPQSNLLHLYSNFDLSYGYAPSNKLSVSIYGPNSVRTKTLTFSLPNARTLTDKPDFAKWTKFNQVKKSTSNISTAVHYLSAIYFTLFSRLRPSISSASHYWQPWALPLARSPYLSALRSRFASALRSLSQHPQSHLLTWHPAPHPDTPGIDWPWISNQFDAGLALRGVLLALSHNLSLPFPFPALGSPVPPELRPSFSPYRSHLFVPTPSLAVDNSLHLLHTSSARHFENPSTYPLYPSDLLAAHLREEEASRAERARLLSLVPPPLLLPSAPEPTAIEEPQAVVA